MRKLKSSKRLAFQSVALTIAGSDSGGGAGLQADLKTFAAVGVHGSSVTTCLTAQNPKRVLGVDPVSPRFVRCQLEAVFTELRPQAAKTGMLFSDAILREVVAWWRRCPEIPLVVDPVMVSTSGAVMMKPGALRRLTNDLFPLATLITPNLDEAQLLLGESIRSVEDLQRCARLAHQRWGCAVLMKGGHLRSTPDAVDVLFDGEREWMFRARFVSGVSTHGTGCTYSAAIVAYLALGRDLPEAVDQAKDYITRAIGNSKRVGDHTVLGFF